LNEFSTRLLKTAVFVTLQPMDTKDSPAAINRLEEETAATRLEQAKPNRLPLVELLAKKHCGCDAAEVKALRRVSKPTKLSTEIVCLRTGEQCRRLSQVWRLIQMAQGYASNGIIRTLKRDFSMLVFPRIYEKTIEAAEGGEE
jgi:hypothetical protein